MSRLAVLLFAMLAVSPALGCPLPAMQGARTAAAAEAALAEILAAGTACNAGQRDWAGRVTAAHLHIAAEAAVAAGDLAGARAMLDRGIAAAPIWQSLALRGDLRQRPPAPDFAAASLDYQAALNAIAAGDPATDPVPEPVIASLWRRAEQSRLLAPAPVASPPTRSGGPGGLALPSVRSFAPVVRAIPIQFVFGRCEVTPGGQVAAQDLAALLEGSGRPAIRLVGHTDPIGGDEANLRLSRCRAQTVRNFLVERGFPPARIEIDGMGERRPLEIDGRDGYTTDQIHQILRRVELVIR